MLGLAVQVGPQYSTRRAVDFPSGFAWDTTRFGFDVAQVGGRYVADLDPRSLVDPAIWTGPAFHVSVDGDDDNTGLGATDGDFSQAKRTIHAAFLAGNATGAPYRVLVEAGRFEGSAFTRNGNQEPDQPVAVLAVGGRVSYRTGPFEADWADAGGTYSTNVSSTRRAFRTDLRTEEGLYTELTKVADVASCAATPGSWVLDGSVTHVNIGEAPGAEDIALIRSYHGARFLQSDQDFYIEGFDVEGGITGGLHFDAVAARNIVGVDCSFCYSAPSNPSAPQSAVRIRRTNGLVAFFGCDASYGAKDGWSFHDDGVLGLHVLLQDCSSWRNGALGATSVNAFTLHDQVYAIALGGAFGLSQNGSDVHIIQDAQAWLAGGRIVARDIDGTSTAIKCSHDSYMWLQDLAADADGAAENYAIEANGGTVFTRGFTAVSGEINAFSGGSVTPF
jgi:hypothetical protein